MTADKELLERLRKLLGDIQYRAEMSTDATAAFWIAHEKTVLDAISRIEQGGREVEQLDEVIDALEIRLIDGDRRFEIQGYSGNYDTARAAIDAALAAKGEENG